MRLTPPALEIDDAQGFSKSDLFGRAQFASGLTTLLSKVSEPVVLALDAPWGAGKTVFLKMWAGELRKQGFPVVYFDAFQHDFADDCFIALAGEVIALADSVAPNKRRDDLVRSAVKVAKVLARSGLKLGVKTATLGALDLADLGDAAKDIGAEAGAVADKYFGEALTKQKEQRNTIDRFKTALSAIPEGLARVGDESASRPLVFIIDELDRCRPMFALELLERVKHFFSVPNVHFVLGVNQEQLRVSIQSAYGANIDANLYLQKFIHVTFFLNEATDRHEPTTITKYIAHLQKVMDFDAEQSAVVYYTSQVIEALAVNKDLSLRTIERVFGLLALVVAFTPKGLKTFPALLGGLCVMKVLEPSLFKKAKRGELLFDEAVRFLSGFDAQLDWWRFTTGAEMDTQLQQDYRRELFVFSFGPEGLLPFVANLIDRVRPGA
jgi:hypothetical protein